MLGLEKAIQVRTAMQLLWLTGRYATDPSYNAKLNNVITAYNLTQYDTPSSGGNTGGGTVNPGTGGSNNQSGTNTYYTVKSGDTLNKIAAQYGVSVANLRSWNGISGDLIFRWSKTYREKKVLQVTLVAQAAVVLTIINQERTRTIL